MYKVSYNYDDKASSDLRNTLEQLGLTGHEPAVYAALLERSPAGAAWIAKRCGLSRSSVYTTLGVLVGKGLIGESHANEVKQFVTGGPGALLELLRQDQVRAETRVARATKLADELAKLSGSAQLPEVVHSSKGPKGCAGSTSRCCARARPALHCASCATSSSGDPAWAFVFEDGWRAKANWRLKQGRRTDHAPVRQSLGDRAQARGLLRLRAAISERRYLACLRSSGSACDLAGRYGRDPVSRREPPARRPGGQRSTSPRTSPPCSTRSGCGDQHGPGSAAAGSTRCRPPTAG